MSKKNQSALSPKRNEDYPKWYQEVIKAADLAENSAVRGCMVIKPWGFGIWENIHGQLDVIFKSSGIQNAYFPLFIPLSYFQKEAEHIEGFAKECAVVTHHRLESDAEGKLFPAGELEEPLIVRPTSETIIGESFSKWITSYRDLPLKINQWANVVRWEMRTRLFLRTTEFLWQEGHTVHENKEEAVSLSLDMLDIYVQFSKDVLAIPFIPGEKTPKERFPGAVATYTIEAMMQDRKALQGGTSHFLGQTFSKASNIRFRNKEGDEEFGWTTSWGVATRLIGAIIMIHSDDDGLVLPPRIAPSQVVLLPVMHKEESKAQVLDYCHKLKETLAKLNYHGQSIDVLVDERDIRGGEKLWGWIKKGIPLRVEIGPRDIDQDKLPIARRDRSHREKENLSRAELIENLPQMLDSIQDNLYKRALEHQNTHTIEIKDSKEFYEFFTPKNKEKPEIHGGFALAHWCGDEEVEDQIQKDLGVTIRCLPFDEGDLEMGKCIFTGKVSPQKVIFAKSY